MADEKPEPDHWLWLADGNFVESSGAIPTQIAMPDGTILKVVAAHKIEKVNE